MLIKSFSNSLFPTFIRCFSCSSKTSLLHFPSCSSSLVRLSTISPAFYVELARSLLNGSLRTVSIEISPGLCETFSPEQFYRPFLFCPPFSVSSTGCSLPTSPHAISVSLPTFESVELYEEFHPSLMDCLTSGYPRFYQNSIVKRANEIATKRVGTGELVCLMSSQQAANRGVKFFTSKGENSARVLTFNNSSSCPVSGLVFAPSLSALCSEFLQHFGFGLSSRGSWDFCFSIERKNQKSSKNEIKTRLAKLLNQPLESISLYPSGMAGIATVLDCLVNKLERPLNTVQLGFPYLDTLKLQHLLSSNSLLLNPANEFELDKWEGKILAGEQFDLAIAEFPTNPKLEEINLKRVSSICRSAKVRIPLLLDLTLSLGCGDSARQLAQIADFVFVSLSKSFSGYGDVMSGAIAALHWNEEINQTIEKMSGDSLYSEDAIILAENSRDFDRRSNRMKTNSIAVAEEFRHHSSVNRLFYSENSFVLSVEFHDPLFARRFFASLAVAKGPGLGNTFTTACPYTLLAHYKELKWAKDNGLEAHLIRISVGTEEENKLREIIRQALREASS
jgi:cystathionine gamma-synthase